jgi:hypothetical protein
MRVIQLLLLKSEYHTTKCRPTNFNLIVVDYRIELSRISFDGGGRDLLLVNLWKTKERILV